MLDVRKWPIFSLCSEEQLKLICQACVFGSAGNEVLYMTVNDEDLEELCFRFCINHLTVVKQTSGFAEMDHDLKNFISEASRVGAFKN